MENQAPYLPCFAASDPMFSAEECRKIHDRRILDAGNNFHGATALVNSHEIAAGAPFSEEAHSRPGD